MEGKINDSGATCFSFGLFAWIRAHDQKKLNFDFGFDAASIVLVGRKGKPANGWAGHSETARKREKRDRQV